jgi:hypothetical protein
LDQAQTVRAGSDLHPACVKMGSPQYPTKAQIKVLQEAAVLPEPERAMVETGKLAVTVPTHGLVLIKLIQPQ